MSQAGQELQDAWDAQPLSQRSTRVDKVSRTLNVVIEKHSKEEYGTGLDQGVKFAGIDGYWTIRKLSDLYENDKIASRWPAAIGSVFRARLQAKPAKKAGCFYRDIWEIEAATGEPESWDWQAELAGVTPATGKGDEPPFLRQPTAPGMPTIPFTINNGAVNATGHSIERQVVLKAMAEVVAASCSDGGTFEADTPLGNLFTSFTARCDELWGAAAEPIGKLHASFTARCKEIQQDGGGSERAPVEHPNPPSGPVDDGDWLIDDDIRF